MMQKLSGRLRRGWRAFSFLFRRTAVRRCRVNAPAVRGNMGRVILITPPDPMFSQAMFILRDDYFQTPGLSRQELLTQARSAAEDYVRSELSGREGTILPSAAALFSLGAASAILALWIGGVI